jgi:hypothetical protein
MLNASRRVVHLYLSTACQHDRHEMCRLSCEFCGSLCLCACHSDGTLVGVNLKLDQLLTRMVAVATQEKKEMASVQDVQAQVAALQASVAHETDVNASILLLVKGFPPILADLQKQLADAIAAGADPAALQAVVDQMAAAGATIDANAQALADAAATPPPPAA